MHEGIKSYHQEIDNACNFLNHIIGELVYKSKMHLNCLQYTNVIIEDEMPPIDAPEAMAHESCKVYTKSKERKFECEICKKAYYTKTQLKTHEISHKDERPFSCEICGATFRYKNSLTGHVRSHNDERPFECHICNQKFKTKVPYESHVESHDGVKKISCNYCDMKFFTKSAHFAHMIIHRKPNRFKCPHEGCTRTFNFKHHLQNHLNMHTGNISCC